MHEDTRRGDHGIAQPQACILRQHAPVERIVESFQGHQRVALQRHDGDARAGRRVELVRHPVRKDRTDGEMAADEALHRGAGELVLAGALGALDHTLGHLAILRRLAARGVAARLAAPRLTVRVFAAPDEVQLDAPAGTRVSIVPLQGDALVTLGGFDYALDRGVLPQDACLGLGNAVVAAARILVHEGSVAVLVEDGGEAFGGVRRGARVAAP